MSSIQANCESLEERMKNFKKWTGNPALKWWTAPPTTAVSSSVARLDHIYSIVSCCYVWKLGGIIILPPSPPRQPCPLPGFTRNSRKSSSICGWTNAAWLLVMKPEVDTLAIFVPRPIGGCTAAMPTNAISAIFETWHYRNFWLEILSELIFFSEMKLDEA